ncbi:MAG: vWA domain-containing protein [Bellilinea sp.]
MLMFQMFHVTLQSESKLIARQTPTQRVLELRVRAPESPENAARTPLNLALVLDRSGSMSGIKLEYVKQAAQHVIDLLSTGDRAALVSFDNQISVDVPNTLIQAGIKAQIKERISSIRSGNTTNLSGGWTQGCQEVAANAESRQQINRVLLLTDGLANVGITDTEVLSLHARELAERGVSTSTFGVGEGFNEHLLEGMSNQGSGNFYFIANPQEIPAIFMREFKELTAVTAREVQVTLTLPEHTAVEVLGGWRYTLNGNKLQIFLGDLPGGREQEVYLKLLLPPSDTHQNLSINAAATGVGLHDQGLSDETRLRFQYADAEEIAKAPVAQDVLERYAKVDMSEQTTAALKLERDGKREQARKKILQSLQENRPSLSPDQVEYYEDMAGRMEHGMIEQDRKTSQYNAYNIKRQRPSDK